MEEQKWSHNIGDKLDQAAFGSSQNCTPDKPIAREPSVALSHSFSVVLLDWVSIVVYHSTG